MSVSNNSDLMDRLIVGIDGLHSSPSVAQKILLLTRNSDFKMKEVVACLERDPGLTARILRVVNSSRYGLGRQISSVRHAATYLGQRSLRLFAVTFSLVDTLTKGVHKGISSEYWPRALAMATVAGRLAKDQAGVEDNDAYTTGLLADVGILVFAQTEAASYGPVYDECEHGQALVTGEEELFGFAHPALGARLLEKWDLPAHVVVAVADHHDSTADSHPLGHCVRASNLVADALIAPTPQKIDRLRQDLSDRLGLSVDDLADLAAACRTDMQESAAIFGETAFSSEMFANFIEMLQNPLGVAEDAEQLTSSV